MVQTDAFGHSRPSFLLQKKNHRHREQCLMTKNIIDFYHYYFGYIAYIHHHWPERYRLGIQVEQAIPLRRKPCNIIMK